MKHKTLFAVVVCLVAATVLAPPIGQDPTYHIMADQRPLIGIPNALNVISNIGFLIAGAMGLVETRDLRDRWTRWPYLVFFAGAALTAFGSTWYHLSPDNDSVVWDRLPMTIAFSGLLTAVLAERVSERIARDVFVPLVAGGALSVIYWYATELGGHGDLRPYALLQFGSLVVMLTTLLAYRASEAGDAYLWSGLALYVAAKVFELADASIYDAMGISGHTLKHVAAAAGIGFVAMMLDARSKASRGTEAMALIA
ncbi:MAG TPA: ceramidase domain-containing protein [Vicinamibacterales bacterium]|nr:ceramidase domain-containing protein [Vicinamibacterales bacterium]